MPYITVKYVIKRTFWSDHTSFETDLYTVIIVRRLELKLDATQLEIDDTKFLSCLSVVPLAMEATGKDKIVRHKCNNCQF